MTIVVALATKQGCYMAADSATNVYDRPIIGGARKIHRLPLAGQDEALLGYAGDGAISAIIPTQLKVKGTPDRAAPPDEIHTWAHAVAFAVTELALDAGLRTSDTGRMDASLLLGWHGHLWTLTHMQAIPHREGVAAIGCGEELAMGALEVLLDLTDLEPLEMVTRAAHVACKYDRYCFEPLQVEVLASREV